jgi:hypothetical protein
MLGVERNSLGDVLRSFPRSCRHTIGGLMTGLLVPVMTSKCKRIIVKYNDTINTVL